MIELNDKKNKINKAAVTIKKIRTTLHLSLRELGHALGAAKTTIYRYEHSIQLPSRLMRQKIKKFAAENNITITSDDLEDY